MALLCLFIFSASSCKTHTPHKAFASANKLGSAWGWTPLQTLYAVECLENRTRAKGSGANFLFLNIAMVVNTYGIAIGIEAIGWKLYLVYIGWIVVEVRNRDSKTLDTCRLTFADACDLLLLR